MTKVVIWWKNWCDEIANKRNRAQFALPHWRHLSSLSNLNSIYCALGVGCRLARTGYSYQVMLLSGIGNRAKCDELIECNSIRAFTSQESLSDLSHRVIHSWLCLAGCEAAIDERIKHSQNTFDVYLIPYQEFAKAEYGRYHGIKWCVRKRPRSIWHFYRYSFILRSENLAFSS